MIFTSKNITFIGLFLITSFALILRLYKLDTSFWFDEGFIGYSATLSIKEMLAFLTHEQNHPPLYFIIVNFLEKVFPGDFSIRLFSVLTGIVSVPLFYMLGRKLFDHHVGILASLFLAISGWHLYASQEAHSYSLYFLLGLITTNLLVAAIQAKKNVFRYWCAYVISLALFVYTHYIAFFILLGLAAFYFCMIWPPNRRTCFTWSISHLSVLLIYIPWIPSMIEQYTTLNKSYMSVHLLPRPTVQSILGAFISYTSFVPWDVENILAKYLNVDLIWALARILYIPCMALLCSALFFLDRAHRREIISLAVLALVPLTALTFYSMSVGTMFPSRVLIPIVIPILLLLSIPWYSPQEGRRKSVIILLTGFAMLVSLSISIAHLRNRDNPNWRQAASIISEEWKAGDAALVLPRGGQYALSSYLQNLGKETSVVNGKYDVWMAVLHINGKTVYAWSSTEDMISNLAHILGSHQRLWVVRDHRIRSKWTAEVLDRLETHFSVRKRYMLQGLDMVLLQL